MFSSSSQVAGIIYRFNLFRVQQWLKLPESLTSAVSRAFGNMFTSGNPPSQAYAMGATLEIQRLQQMEHYEQQAMRARMGHLRNRVNIKQGKLCSICCMYSIYWTEKSFILYMK